jgi:hypothetical protein
MKRSASTECFDNGGTAVLVPPYNTVKYEITTPYEMRLVMTESKIYPLPSLAWHHTLRRIRTDIFFYDDTVLWVWVLTPEWEFHK